MFDINQSRDVIGDETAILAFHLEVVLSVYEVLCLFESVGKDEVVVGSF